METKEEDPVFIKGVMRAFPISRRMHRYQSGGNSSQSVA